MSYILDIEEKAEGLVYTVLRKTPGKLNAESSGMIPCSLKDGDPVVFHEHLGGIREKYGVREARVLLPYKYFLSSIIEVPVKRKHDVEAALVFELEENLPMTIVDYLTDHAVIGRRNGSTRIFTLSIGKKFVDKIVDWFKSEGLEVTSVRCGFMDRFSAAYSFSGKKNFLLIDSDKNDFSVAAVSNGTLVQVNHVSDIGYLDTIVTGIKNKYGMQDIILTGDPGDELREMTGSTGATQTVRGMKRWRKRTFDLEVYRASAREWSIRERKVFVLVVLVLSIFMTVSGFFLPVYRDYQALGKVSGQIEQIKAKATGLFEKRERLELQREKIRFIKDIMDTRDVPLAVLAELSTLLPDNVWLISFSIDEKGFIELKGFADDTAKLVEMLERSEKFRNIGFSSPILTSGDKVRFSVRMELER